MGEWTHLVNDDDLVAEFTKDGGPQEGVSTKEGGWDSEPVVVVERSRVHHDEGILEYHQFQKTKSRLEVGRGDGKFA